MTDKSSKFSNLILHTIHLLPLRDVDYARLATHLTAALLLALSACFTTGMSLHLVLMGWMGTSLIYVSGYLQRGVREDVVIAEKVYPKAEEGL